MLTSILLGLVIAITIAVGFVIWTLLLALGLRWAKAREWTWRRVALTTVVVNVVSTAYLCLVVWLIGPQPEQKLAAAALVLVGYFVSTVGVISWIFRVPVWRALQAWLPTLLSGVVALAFSHAVVRPLLFEVFLAPTNSMAPTLLGWHGRDTCGICGGTCYFSLPPEQDRHVRWLPMICDKFHVSHQEPQSMSTFVPTRFVVAKFLEPHRWDVMVFDEPADPQHVYVKRVVGLPGETVVIADGKVMIDGEEIEVPEDLQGIVYLSEMPWGHDVMPILAGSAENPAKLADDEYFVLGDFSITAYDSRLWEQGADGHPTYAVPSSHVRGVVSHILWPPERFRVLR